MKPHANIKLTVRELARLEERFKEIPETSWEALAAWFRYTLAGAEDAACHPDTSEDKRAHWAGHMRALRDLGDELVEIREGLWRKWSDVEKTETAKRDGEENES